MLAAFFASTDATQALIDRGAAGISTSPPEVALITAPELVPFPARSNLSGIRAGRKSDAPARPFPGCQCHQRCRQIGL